MEGIMFLVSIIIIVFGILQIILFFKIWGMTNNVSSIKKWTEKKLSKEDVLIREAQLYALDGNYECAISNYQKAFQLSVIELYENLVSEYGDKDEYPERDSVYKNRYNSVISYYEKRINKVQGKLDKEKYESFDKVNAIISKI